MVCCLDEPAATGAARSSAGRGADTDDTVFPGETRYDPSVGFLPSFKRLSLSVSFPLPWPPAQRGGDALRQLMMRCFPGETWHDPTVGIPTPLRGPGPGLR